MPIDLFALPEVSIDPIIFISATLN